MRHVLVWIWLVFPIPLFISCVAAPRVVSDVKASSYALVYDLASDYELKISSPDLNRKAADQRPVSPRLIFPSDNVYSDPRITSMDNLDISLHSGASFPRAGLLLHFSDDEGQLLDRAELDTRVVDETWILGLGLSTHATSAEEGVPTYALGVVSELSGLWARHEAPSRLDGRTLRVAEKTGVRGFARASGIAEDDLLTALEAEGVAVSSQSLLDAGTWQLIGQRFGLTVEPQSRYYLAFHDISAGLGEDGTRTLLVSLGGFLPEWGGEIVTTYRLLQYDEASGFATDRAGFTEQALGLTYAEQFDGWMKYFSHSLSYFDYREDDPRDDSLIEEDPALAEIPEDGEKWRNSTLFSVGSDLDSPFLGLIKGYRMDVSHETETLVLRSGGEDDRRNSLMGSHLKIKTALGTFFGRIQQSDTLRKRTIGVQKKGWANARLNLYVEEIDSLTSGFAETRVSGQLYVPMERSLFDVFTLDFWKIAEDNLFAPLRRRGYLAPSRGHHVSDLNNSSPGIAP